MQKTDKYKYNKRMKNELSNNQTIARKKLLQSILRRV